MSRPIPKTTWSEVGSANVPAHSQASNSNPELPAYQHGSKFGGKHCKKPSRLDVQMCTRDWKKRLVCPAPYCCPSQTMSASAASFNDNAVPFVPPSCPQVDGGCQKPILSQAVPEAPPRQAAAANMALVDIANPIFRIPRREDLLVHSSHRIPTACVELNACKRMFVKARNSGSHLFLKVLLVSIHLLDAKSLPGSSRTT